MTICQRTTGSGGTRTAPIVRRLSRQLIPNQSAVAAMVIPSTAGTRRVTSLPGAVCGHGQRRARRSETIPKIALGTIAAREPRTAMTTPTVGIEAKSAAYTEPSSSHAPAYIAETAARGREGDREFTDEVCRD